MKKKRKKYFVSYKYKILYFIQSINITSENINYLSLKINIRILIISLLKIFLLIYLFKKY